MNSQAKTDTCRHSRRSPISRDHWRCDDCLITGVYAKPVDAAIRHLESVHRVIVARRNGAKVIPFPSREAGRAPA